MGSWYLFSYPKQQKNTSKHLFLAKRHVNWEAETDWNMLAKKAAACPLLKTWLDTDLDRLQVTLHEHGGCIR